MGQKHKRFREFRTPFPLRDICKNPRSNVRACAAGDGAICSKNRKIVPYHGAIPNTRNGARLRSPSLIMAPGCVPQFVSSLRVIKHLELCQARRTLIVPLWKSSFVWNSCSKDEVHWSSFVIDWVYLPKFQGLFIKAKTRNSLFGSRSFNFDVVALRIDFSRPRPRSSLREYCTLPPGKM